MATSTRRTLVFAANTLMVVSGSFCCLTATDQVAADRGQLPPLHISRAIPVVGQAVLITVPHDTADGDSAMVIRSPRGQEVSLPISQTGQVTWIPRRYGKHQLRSEKAELEVWVSTRPLTFHWWDGEVYEPRDATVIMGDPEKNGTYWKARGIIPVEWAAGECNKAGWTRDKIETPDGWKTPQDWFNGWYGENETCRKFSGGIAIDEACLQMEGQPLTTAGITGGMKLTRQAAGKDFHVGLYIACISDPVSAWLFRQADATSLIENYWADFPGTVRNWQSTASRWGLQRQSLLTIAPAFDEKAPTTEAQVRRNVADQRLAAPEMAGLALFNAADNGDKAALVRKAYAAADQAIEDYFLKPVIFLRPRQGGLIAENIGNEDARDVSLVFLDARRKPIQQVQLPDLQPDQQHRLHLPAGTQALQLKLPATQHSLYPNSIFRLAPALDPLQVVTSSIKDSAVLPAPDGRLQVRLTFNKKIATPNLDRSCLLLTGQKGGVQKTFTLQKADNGRELQVTFANLATDSYMFCLKGGQQEAIVDADGFALDGDQDGFIEPDDWFTLFFALK